MTPTPIRSLAPRTRSQDAAVNDAAAVPARMKLRRVRPCVLNLSLFAAIFIYFFNSDEASFSRLVFYSRSHNHRASYFPLPTPTLPSTYALSPFSVLRGQA